MSPWHKLLTGHITYCHHCQGEHHHRCSHYGVRDSFDLGWHSAPMELRSSLGSLDLGTRWDNWVLRVRSNHDTIPTGVFTYPFCYEFLLPPIDPAQHPLQPNEFVGVRSSCRSSASLTFYSFIQTFILSMPHLSLLCKRWWLQNHQD